MSTVVVTSQLATVPQGVEGQEQINIILLKVKSVITGSSVGTIKKHPYFPQIVKGIK